MTDIYGTRPGSIWLLASRHFRVARDRIPAIRLPAGKHSEESIRPGAALCGPPDAPIRATATSG